MRLARLMLLFSIIFSRMYLLFTLCQFNYKNESYSSAYVLPATYYSYYKVAERLTDELKIQNRKEKEKREKGKTYELSLKDRP